MNNKALIVKNLNFKFTQESKPFFENVNVEFDAGKIHFIKGKNGVGKSVFFRILQSNLNKNEIYSADIFIDGQEFHATTQNPLPTKYTSKIKLVSQKFDSMIADKFSFKQNLSFANFEHMPLFSGLPAHKPLPDFLSKFNINIFEPTQPARGELVEPSPAGRRARSTDYDKPVIQLSGGQRQILAIMMAIQKACTFLLLDEPTSALDPQNSETVMEFIKDLVAQTGIIVLIICHDSELVERYASDGFYEIVVTGDGKREIVLRNACPT